MQQVVATRIGDPSVLQVQTSPDPLPKAGEVRVKVEAAGVNYAEAQARAGLYPDAPPFPAVLGYEAAGVIDMVGEGVDAARIGEPVVALLKFGGYSSHLVLPSRQAVRRPASIDAFVGAAIPVAGLTAWMLVEEMGRVRAGDRVLVHSAGGAVGLMVLDLCKRRGAVVVGTASKKKHEFLKERGYDQLVDYTTEDFEAVLKTGPKFDLILDPVGGDSWNKGVRLLRTGGKLICFGMSSNASGETRSVWHTLKNMTTVPWFGWNPIALMNKSVAVAGLNMLHVSESDPERILPWFTELMTLAEQGVIRPILHAKVPFSQAPEAHRMLGARANIGKILLIPDGPAA